MARVFCRGGRNIEAILDGMVFKPLGILKKIPLISMEAVAEIYVCLEETSSLITKRIMSNQPKLS